MLQSVEGLSPRPGDIVFFHVNPQKPLDYLIALFSKSKHQIVHVAIYYDDNMTYEINFGERACQSTLSHYRNSFIEIKRFNGITDKQRNQIIRWCQLNMNHHSYDLLEILKLFFYYFGISIPYHEKYRLICSTFVYNAYRYAGILLSKGKDPTPESEYDVPELETVARGYV